MKTTAATEEARPALVPKLRFPEFRGTDVWHEGKIADIAVSESSSRALNKLSLKSEGYPVYGADSCVGFIDSFDQADDYIAIVKDGSGVGRLSLKRGKSSVLGTLAYIKCKPRSETKLTWLYYCLNSLDLRQFIKGSGIPHIYFSDYASHEVLIPPPSEQQKIAECLSSVDGLMAAHARKVDALKTHKKGLMQQLFPREGETQPRLRFPEFQSARGWAENSLGQLIEIASGQVDPKKPPYCDAPQIGSENIESDSGNLVDVKSAGEKGVISGNYVFDENDILYSKIRPALNKVAAPEFKGICSADIYPIRPADGSLLRSYLFYLLLSQGFLDYAIRNSERGKIPKINRDALLTFKALIPSPAEQQRIASCLSSLDALITAETQKLEALKAHKKGLMQQLFPLPEELEA